jgi:hypothetical protein
MPTSVLTIPSPAEQLHSDVPRLWRVICERNLGCQPALSKRLWRVFVAKVATPDALYLLRQADQYTDSVRVGLVLAVLTPRALMDAAEALAPRSGVRPRELIELERNILARAINAHTWD